MTKISVIIPIYNTAGYLKECIESVLNQSFKDIEVICVNDGSDDVSRDVLESYSSKDDRVKVITQENKGLGAARNVAVSKATGKYILFLDSDDYMEEESLVDIFDLAESKSLDFLMFKIINFDNENYEKVKVPYFEMKFLKKMVGDEVFDWKQVQDKLFRISVTCPGKFFRTDLIKNIKFPEGVIFEDTVFFFKMIFKANRIYFHDEYLYNRRIRDDSITNSYFNSFSDCIVVYDMVRDVLKRNGNYALFSKQLFDRKCKDIFTRFSSVDEEYKPDFFDKIQKNFKDDKKSLERDSVFSKCSDRSLTIFNSALESDTYKEFELSVNLFDLEVDHDKLKLKHDLSKRRYEKKISNLKQANDQYLNEIEDLKNSSSLKPGNVFRKFSSSFKRQS